MLFSIKFLTSHSYQETAIHIHVTVFNLCSFCSFLLTVVPLRLHSCPWTCEVLCVGRDHLKRAGSAGSPLGGENLTTGSREVLRFTYEAVQTLPPLRAASGLAVCIACASPLPRLCRTRLAAAAASSLKYWDIGYVPVVSLGCGTKLKWCILVYWYLAVLLEVLKPLLQLKTPPDQVLSGVQGPAVQVPGAAQAQQLKILVQQKASRSRSSWSLKVLSTTSS